MIQVQSNNNSRLVQFNVPVSEHFSSGTVYTMRGNKVAELVIHQLNTISNSIREKISLSKPLSAGRYTVSLQGRLGTYTKKFVI